MPQGISTPSWVRFGHHPRKAWAGTLAFRGNSNSMFVVSQSNRRATMQNVSFVRPRTGEDCTKGNSYTLWSRYGVGI
jgi:hypothetical protein